MMMLMTQWFAISLILIFFRDRAGAQRTTCTTGKASIYAPVMDKFVSICTVYRIEIYAVLYGMFCLAIVDVMIE